MLLGKLFSSKQSKEGTNTQNQAVSQDVQKWIWYFAKRVAMILWISAALQSNPVLSEENQFQKEEVSQEVATHQKEEEIKKIKLAKAVAGDSVQSFMIRSFWVSTGWELLVWKDGTRIRNPRTDLIAGKEYILARDEKEAQQLVSIMKKRTSQKSSQSPVSSISKEKKQETFLDRMQQNITTNLSSIAFDFSSYLQAISRIESRGNYSASNAKKWVQYWVNSQKHAKWKYQFTKETLAGYGIKTEEQRRHFLSSPKLQEQIMQRFTYGNLNFAMNSPTVSKLIQQWVHTHEVLASMHHMWAGWVEKVARVAVQSDSPREMFFKKLKQSSDWLWTRTSDYVENISTTYSRLVWDQQKVSQVSIEQPLQIPKTDIPVVSTRSQQPKPVKKPILVSTVAANQDVYTELKIHHEAEVFVISQKQKETVSSQGDKQEQIPLIQPEVTSHTSEVIKAYYKKQILSKISSDSSLSPSFKEHLIEKLSKVDDLEAYYIEQIKYYNNILQTSNNDIEKQRAKRILLWLVKLHQDTKRIVQAENDSLQKVKKAA